MPRRAHTRFHFVLLALALLAPLRAKASSQSELAYGPLPVFELHSGFWINLHHTLYHQARLRKDAAPQDKPSKTSGPALKTPAEAKPAYTAAEQKAWEDAVSYYAANLADKDLLFSSELVQLKNQLSDFEDCDDRGLRRAYRQNQKILRRRPALKTGAGSRSRRSRLPRASLAGARPRQSPLDSARRPARHRTGRRPLRAPRGHL